MIERAPNALSFSLSGKTTGLLQREEVVSLLHHINEEYYYWHKIKVLPLPQGVNALDIWGIVKLRRKIDPVTVQFSDYRFHWNINNKLQELLHVLDMNVSGSLESSNKISTDDKGRYLVSSLMEEAIASSQIEGAVTTRKKAKEMLRQNKKPANKSEQMIANNYATIRRIIEIKTAPLNKETLLEIHRLITNDTLSNPAEEGAFRTDNDVNLVDMATGDIVHHPPDYEEFGPLLTSLYDFFNDKEMRPFVHPLVKASIIHFMVGFIHPFANGNGRTARALFYWYLLKKGYWLTEYLSISRLILRSKAQYAGAFQFTEIDEHDLTYFVLFNLKVMNLAFDELRAYIQRKNEEKKEMSGLMGFGGISYRQSLILDWFHKDPALLLTIKETQTRFAISNGSARNDLKELHEKGFLQMRHINKVKAGFIKSANFDGLLRDLRKDPPQ